MTSKAQRRKRPQPPRRVRQVEPDRRVVKLLAKAGPDGVPAAVSRRRIRTGQMLLTLATATGVVLPALLNRAGWIGYPAPVVGAGVGGLASIFLKGLHDASTVVRHGPGSRLVTGRTVLGPRTVDLAELTRIRRLRTRTRSGWSDQLWITDRSGVFLLTEDRDVLTSVAALVGRPQPAGQADECPPGPPVQCSRAAAVRLGLETPTRRYRAARAVIDSTTDFGVLVAGAGLGALAGWGVLVA